MDEQEEDRRGLIDELERVSATLGPPGPLAPLHADIPVLLDVVELPAAASTGPAGATTAPGAQLQAALELEAVTIVDDLIDEFLPLIEARLRERLAERARQLAQGSPPD